MRDGSEVSSYADVCCERTHLSLVERSKHGKSSDSVTGDETSSEHLSPLSGRRDLDSNSDEEDEEAACVRVSLALFRKGIPKLTR